MKPNNDEPGSVHSAKNLVRNWSVGITGWCLSLVPLVMAANAMGIPDPGWLVGAWFGFSAIGAYLVPWRKMNQATALIAEYQRREAIAELSSDSVAGAELASDHPMYAIASRVRELGGDDPRVSSMVDAILPRLEQVDRDADFLREAVAAEESIATPGEDDRRLQRLTAVLAQKEALAEQLSGALRDLHVELSVSQGQDHDAIFGQVGDLLAGLSAEAEIDQVAAEGEPDRLRRLQAKRAQKQRG